MLPWIDKYLFVGAKVKGPWKGFLHKIIGTVIIISGAEIGRPKLVLYHRRMCVPKHKPNWLYTRFYFEGPGVWSLNCLKIQFCIVYDLRKNKLLVIFIPYYLVNAIISLIGSFTLKINLSLPGFEYIMTNSAPWKPGTIDQLGYQES